MNGYNKDGMSGSAGVEGAMGGREAGELDNRLSLDPNDPKFKALIADWKDGETYNLMLTVQQVSPGEFEVTDAKEHEATEEPAAAESETGSEGATEGGTEENPAIKKMME